MLIKNVSVLYGKDLTFIQNVNIIIENGVFETITKDPIAIDGDVYDGDVYDGKGSLIIPGLINAHTHIADSIAKDVGSDLGLDQRVNPISSIKRTVLKESKKEHLTTYMKTSLLSMLKKGITSFADFREDGIDGIGLLKDAVGEMGIRCICLGRVEYYFSENSIQNNDELPKEVARMAEKVINSCDGFGISGANEYSDKALKYFRRIGRENGKLLAIHVAETVKAYEYSLKNCGKSEVTRIVENLIPDFVVHMTNATDEDIRRVAEKNIGIIVCPRANGVIGAGIPKIARMIKYGCKIAIGTDNVMLNSPDLFRELDYLWKVSRALESTFLSAKELVKMVTVNPANILKLEKLGYIEEKMFADAIFIDTHSVDIEPMHDPYTTIVHRVNESNIMAVMKGGKVVHGEL